MQSDRKQTIDRGGSWALRASAAARAKLASAHTGAAPIEMGEQPRPAACATALPRFTEFLTKLRGNNLTTSDAPLVIGAGLGTTATRSFARALSTLGLRTWHWSTLFNCLGKSECGAEEMRESRALANELTALEHLSYASALRHFDFRAFGRFEAVLDDPVPQYVAPLLATFPNARVILTQREALAWAASRLRDHASSIAPLKELYSKTGVSGGSKPESRGIADPAEWAGNGPGVRYFHVKNSITTRGLPDGSASENGVHDQQVQLAAAAQVHEAHIACLVPPDRLLVIDRIESMCSRELWRSLVAFLPPHFRARSERAHMLAHKGHSEGRGHSPWQARADGKFPFPNSRDPQCLLECERGRCPTRMNATDRISQQPTRQRR